MVRSIPACGVKLFLYAGAAGLALSAMPLVAQTPPRTVQTPPPTDPAELDPTAPLDPMPDLPIEWPDLEQTDPAPAPETQGVDAAGAQQALDAAAKTTTDVLAAQRYSWSISGIDDLPNAETIRNDFKIRSALELGDSEEANAAQIGRRAKDDSELLTEILRSYGYYDAFTLPQVSVAKNGVAVLLNATPGALYRFESVELPGLDQAAGGEAAKLRQSFAVKAGDPVEAQKVIDAGISLQVALGDLGFATAKVGEQDIVIDHEKQVATLTLPVTPGPIAKFGTFSVTGKPPFSPKHMSVIARFDEGDRFDQADVDDLRRALVATGLVTSAEITQVPRDNGQIIDLAVKLEPAPMRTIAGEIGYGTGEGFRAEASWQNRNFFNPEGALTIRGVVGTQEQAGSVTLRRSNWLRRDQILNAQASVSNIDRDAYAAKTVSVSAGFERLSNFIWQKKWTWSLGAEVLASDERDTVESTGLPRRRTFFIGALPAALGYDGTDSLLDPTTGFRLNGRLSPEISFEGGAKTYAKTQIDVSAYRPVGGQVVAAGRIRLGTIVGAQRDEIAPSRRFYAGGGGSVRGYGYQMIGPRDVDGDPIGGRSLAEFSLEARVRLKAFGGNFGVVPFIDGGSLSTESMPDLKDWQIGVGIGLRYYSSFGPIRIDVGTPLNPQPGDGKIAVVVGLGQAF